LKTTVNFDCCGTNQPDVNWDVKLKVFPSSNDNSKDILPIFSKCGVTQEAKYLLTTFPSAKILPLKRHTIASEVALKHGPEISTKVPPRTKPRRGDRVRPPELT
jgi:hypothetical protein